MKYNYCMYTSVNIYLAVYLKDASATVKAS